MKRFRDILLLWCLSLMAAGCDLTIHEYPDNEISTPVVNFTLNLNFDTEMPLYEVMELSSRSLAELSPEDLDVRYIVNVYRDTKERQESRDIIQQHIITKDDVTMLNHSVDLQLDEGDYIFLVWADYVDAGATTGKFYNADNFESIKIITEDNIYIPANTDFRDAFRGRQTASITAHSTDNVVTVEMKRPFAKFRYISTDLEEFITKMMALKAKAEAERRTREEEEAKARGEATEDDGTRAMDPDGSQREEPDGTKSDDDDTKVDTKLEINLEDYYVIFEYGWLNVSYNAYTDRSDRSEQNMRFRSDITKISATEAEIGFDYVIVNDTEGLSTSTEIVPQVEVRLRVYQKGETADDPDVEVGGFSKRLINLKRSHLTEVRGKFLSSQADGAVGISPGFDDEFTYEID